jgi:hypothetical protein
MEDIMRTIYMLSAIVVCVLFGATILMSGSQAFDKSAAYHWFAEIVSVDEAARTITAKAHLRYDVKPEYKQFKPGERIVIQWYTSQCWRIPRCWAGT